MALFADTFAIASSGSLQIPPYPSLALLALARSRRRSPHFYPRLRAAALLIASVLGPATARAQAHWDVGVQAGAANRFASGGDSDVPSPGLGPTFGLQGHVAIVPMVRAGAYLEQDVSPAGNDGPRTFWAAGVHLRVTPPLLVSPWRAWMFAGAGYAYTYSQGPHASGGLLDLPVGIGLGYKVGGPWVAFGELGVRFGALFHGAMYDHALAQATGAPFVGQDSFALGASVGLSLDR